jgi:UDP:flavonoid glycosyltransferase YjiC (YdhE family)
VLLAKGNGYMALSVMNYDFDKNLMVKHNKGCFMARFLIMTVPYPGHLAPCLPIVRKLVERGHEVVWITGREFEASVEDTGARFHPLPKENDPNGMEVYDFHPELKNLKGLAQIKFWLKHVCIDASSRDIREIEIVLDDFPADVLIGDPMAFGLAFKSEMGGLPLAGISLLPLSLPSQDTASWGLGLLPGNNLVKKVRNRLINFFTYRILFRNLTIYTNTVRRELGLKPLNGSFFEGMWKIPSLIMHISTPVFEYPRSDQPEHFHFIGPILLESDPGFEPPYWWSDLDGSEPVVLVNQGTLATNQDDLIIPTIRGLKEERMLVIAVPAKEGQLPELSANVRAETFIPFDHLLPHVDVMVTNGGYGGTQFALAHGIPLVVAGGTEDKMEVAARVEWAGVGINLKKQRPSPREICAAVKEVLANPVYRENAKRIQADFAKYDAPTQAAELLEAFAKGEL